jgi:hypothetical protein
MQVQQPQPAAAPVATPMQHLPQQFTPEQLAHVPAPTPEGTPQPKRGLFRRGRKAADQAQQQQELPPPPQQP